MSNLIKAEWFRLRHEGSVLKIYIFTAFLAVVSQFVGDDGIKINALNYFLHCSIAICLSVTSAAGFITSTFNSRLVNYEIMKGTPPMQMILSKLFVAITLVTVTYFIPSVILIEIFDGKKLTLSMVMLLFVCVVKVTVMALSICIIFKDAAGIVIFMLMFMMQTMPLVLLQNLAGINVVPLTSYLTTTQLMLIGNLSMLDMEEMSMPLSTEHTGINIIISCIMLIAVIIPLAHKSLKDKWEIKLTNAA